MVNENDRPPVAPQEEMDDQPPMMGGGKSPKMPNVGGGGGLVRTAIVALVVTLIVVLVVNMTGSMWVSKTDFTTNLSNMSATIDQMKTADKATTDTVKGLPASVSTTVADAVSKATSGVSTQLSTLTSTVNGFSQKINDASSQASAATNQINSMNGQIASLKADNETLKKQVSDLKSGGSSTDLTALTNRVKALETSVATLQSSGGSSGTITGGGGSSGGSTSSSGTGVATSADGKTKVSIISYSYTSIFGGNTSAPAVLTFTPQNYGASATQPSSTATLVSVGGGSTIWLNNATSQNFQMQIQNNTGRTITDIQISLAFMWIKPDGTQISLPYSTTYSMSSMGNPQWTNTGNDQTYTAWMTGSSNSVLGSIWSFSQAPGTNSYYSSLSITLPTVTSNATALSLPALNWYAVPILKVISYNLQ